MKKKVIVYAYMNQNLGDDLFIEILCKRYPNVQFQLMLENDVDITFTKTLTNLQVKRLKKSLISFFWNRLVWNNSTGKHRFLLAELVPEKKELESADAVIYIGGSLFMQRTDKRMIEVERWQQRVNYMKEFYLLGCNFGPYLTEDYVKAYSNVFKKSTDVCMRDEKSANLFKDIPTVRQATDIVLGMEVAESVKEKLCLISVIDFLGDRSELLEKREMYKNVIRKYTENLVKRGYEVKFVSFCEPQGDLAMSEEIIKSLILTNEQLKKVKIHDYRSNLSEVLTLFSKAELVIATRFHAMILALVSNAKVLPVIYSPKMTNVLDDVCFQGPSVEILNLSEDYLADLDIELLIQSEVLDITATKQLAKTQFEKLDLLLKQKA